MLHFAEVSKKYSNRVILSIPAFTLTDGIYWLTGINGSGKTTLLRILSGLIPFNGEIILNGISLRQDAVAYRRLVNSAEAEPAFPPFLTGEEMIRFHRDIRKSSLEQTDQLVEQLGFGQFLSTPIGTYSSGMMKRLSLLLAFIGKPKLVLLDEPLATLDSEAAMGLPQLIMEYHNMQGTSFIFSSHSPFHDEDLIKHRTLLLQEKSLQLIP